MIRYRLALGMAEDREGMVAELESGLDPGRPGHVVLGLFSIYRVT